MGKKYLKSKTLWTAVIAIVTGLASAATGDTSWQDFAMVAMGAVFAYLRTISNQPLTK